MPQVVADGNLLSVKRAAWSSAAVFFSSSVSAATGVVVAAVSAGGLTEALAVGLASATCAVRNGVSSQTSFAVDSEDAATTPARTVTASDTAKIALRLEFVRQKRLEVLRNGYGIGDIVTEKSEADGIEFKVQVKNITDGHNVPTGFTGERLVWLRITVTDSTGKVVFKSGDTDPNGDVRDNESSYVHAGEMPLDEQLFSLQSRFLVQNVRGGERERTVTIPYSTTSLPFLRPTRLSLILTGESTVERNHRKGIEPLGHRWAEYEIDADMLTGKGPYKATIELMGQMIPINLITTIQVVGFDYGISPRAAADAVVAGREVLVKKTVTFNAGK